MIHLPSSWTSFTVKNFCWSFLSLHNPYFFSLILLATISLKISPIMVVYHSTTLTLLLKISFMFFNNFSAYYLQNAYMPQDFFYGFLFLSIFSFRDFAFPTSLVFTVMKDILKSLSFWSFLLISTLPS